MKRRLVRIAVTLAALAVGVIAGRAIVRGDHEETGTPRRTAKSERRPVPKSPPLVATTAREQVQEVLGIDSFPDRVRATLALAGAIREADLANWLRGAHFRSGEFFLDDLVERILLERLLEHDPHGALRQAMRGDQLRTLSLLAELQERDPEAAVAFLLSPMPDWQRGTLAVQVLQKWTEVDPDRAVALLDKLTRIMLGGESGHPRARHIVSPLGPLLVSRRAELLEAAEDWPTAWRRAVHIEIAKEEWKHDLVGTLQWMVAHESDAATFLRVIESNIESSVDLISHLDLLPAGWLEVVDRSAGYALVRHNPMEWLEADAAELGIESRVLTSIQARAAEQVKDVEDCLRLLPHMAVEVQASLAVRVVNSGFYQDREQTERWLAELEYPEARAAAQARFDHLAGVDNRDLGLPGGLGGGMGTAE